MSIFIYVVQHQQTRSPPNLSLFLYPVFYTLVFARRRIVAVQEKVWYHWYQWYLVVVTKNNTNVVLIKFLQKMYVW